MPEIDLNNTFGALLIGVIVSSWYVSAFHLPQDSSQTCDLLINSLFGVTSLQTWYYFQHYTDSIGVKLMVRLKPAELGGGCRLTY